jgi:hypothetical protein
MSYTREQLLTIQSAARVYQARADDAFAPWGMRAKEPVIGEDPDRYRRKLMIQAKNQLPDNHELRGVTVNKLPADALEAYEPLFFKACKESAYRADSVPAGELRRVEEVDANGNKSIKFIGQQCFVRDLVPPVRRVLGFRTPQGFMNTSGRYLR